MITRTRYSEVQGAPETAAIYMFYFLYQTNAGKMLVDKYTDKRNGEGITARGSGSKGLSLGKKGRRGKPFPVLPFLMASLLTGHVSTRCFRRDNL